MNAPSTLICAASSGDCLVVASHPRSGTHLMIDFMRRNFAEFGFTPMIWQSSETLYLNLDRYSVQWAGGSWSNASASRDNFIVKSHDLPFDPELPEKLAQFAAGRRCTTIYPFRRMSKTLLSFHSYCASELSIPEFLKSADPYFRVGGTVEALMRRHGEWGTTDALPIDVEDVIARPAAYVRALAAAFGWTASGVADRLPPKRLAGGRLGEIVERLRGRQSSEVVVARRSRRHDEAAFVDREGPLADLYKQLSDVALKPVSL
jgi:hypothetical protein